MKILAINPGSTSTKIALFENEKEQFNKSIVHMKESLPKTIKDQLPVRNEKEQFNKSIVHMKESLPKTIKDQLPVRLDLLHKFLADQNVSISDLTAIIGRGGMLPPVQPGGYIVREEMLEELLSERVTPHASNLGAMLAYAIAAPLGIPAYVYDPVSACSLSEMATITGFKEIKRYAKCHVLNSRATARKSAEKQGKKYEDMRFVVAHLGGGISISAHCYGEIIDVASDDDGAFSPERSGGLPLLDVVDLCYSGKYSKSEMKQKIRGEGGLKALLGTTDCAEIEKMILAGDAYAKLVFDAQAYQIAKGIGIMSVALKYQIDSIILTGGMAYSKILTDNIIEYIKPIAHVEVWPGENEMEALALGALRILKGEEMAREFTKRTS